MNKVTAVRSLSAAEFKKVSKILEDFNNCAPGDWMLSGSLSHRLMAPAIKTQPGLRDIDLILLADELNKPQQLLVPEMKSSFLISRVRKHPSGYYYKLWHVGTKISVDVFSGARNRSLRSTEIILQNTAVRVSSLDESLLHLIGHLLMMNANQMTIGAKYLYNAQQLWKQVERVGFLDLVRERRALLWEFLPDYLRSASEQKWVEFALSLRPVKRSAIVQAESNVDEFPEGLSSADLATAEELREAQPKVSVIGQLKHSLFRRRMRAALLVNRIFRGDT